MKFRRRRQDKIQWRNNGGLGCYVAESIDAMVEFVGGRWRVTRGGVDLGEFESIVPAIAAAEKGVAK